MKGKLIVFEGPDGCGKTTLIENLALRLSVNNKVIILNNITEGSSTGVAIRKMISTEGEAIDHTRIVGLYMSELRYSYLRKNGIKDYLDQGYIVLSSRNHLSTLVYASYDKNNELEIKNANIIINMSNDLPKPDMVFYLKIDLETILNRIKTRDGVNIDYDHWENKDKLDFIIKNYEKELIDNTLKLNIIELNAKMDKQYIENEAFKKINMRRYFKQSKLRLD